MKTLIKNVHVFKDGRNTDLTSVLIEDGLITNIGDSSSTDKLLEVIDGNQGYLIPGLIDAHVHTTKQGLHDALKFGVTTELEMMGRSNRRKNDSKDLVADVFSAGMGVTAEGGHPAELHKGTGIPKSVLEEMAKMTDAEREQFIAEHKKAQGAKGKIETEDDARQFVRAQIENGAEFIKIMLDDGKYEGSSELPILPRNVLKSAIDEAHQNTKLVLAHALEQEYALEAVEMGVDGLAHLFLEKDSKTKNILDKIINNNVFVVPTLVLNSSISGILPRTLINDNRVTNKLDAEWNENLNRTFNSAPYMDFQNSLDNVKYLFEHGATILAGTDVSQPAPNLGGLAHGASLHHELQLLVQAGMSNADVLESATSNIDAIFDLNRGQIAINRRADLLLLKNDPLADIQASLDIVGIWQAGQRVDKKLNEENKNND